MLGQVEQVIESLGDDRLFKADPVRVVLAFRPASKGFICHPEDGFSPTRDLLFDAFSSLFQPSL